MLSETYGGVILFYLAARIPCEDTVKHREKTSSRGMPRGGCKIFIRSDANHHRRFLRLSFSTPPPYPPPARNNVGKTERAAVKRRSSVRRGKRKINTLVRPVTATGRGRYKWPWEYVPAAAACSKCHDLFLFAYPARPSRFARPPTQNDAWKWYEKETRESVSMDGVSFQSRFQLQSGWSSKGEIQSET